MMRGDMLCIKARQMITRNEARSCGPPEQTFQKNGSINVVKFSDIHSTSGQLCSLAKSDMHVKIVGLPHFKVRTRSQRLIVSIEKIAFWQTETAGPGWSFTQASLCASAQ